ncbi:hypothetical protein B0T22DRAFT_111270 [Podospora appendiculata]|uniref:Uncharacterized protein n=1 Tax=Podospora appendiculata TaxID=314037 RepID=A0AAE0XLH5_9PEZI|nr:hypothetical protein B0T22DRAFT_111270 [Podospora appendiculata]
MRDTSSLPAMSLARPWYHFGEGQYGMRGSSGACLSRPCVSIAPFRSPWYFEPATSVCLICLLVFEWVPWLSSRDANCPPCLTTSNRLGIQSTPYGGARVVISDASCVHEADTASATTALRIVFVSLSLREMHIRTRRAPMVLILRLYHHSTAAFAFLYNISQLYNHLQCLQPSPISITISSLAHLSNI